MNALLKKTNQDYFLFSYPGPDSYEISIEMVYHSRYEISQSMVTIFSRRDFMRLADNCLKSHLKPLTIFGEISRSRDSTHKTRENMCFFTKIQYQKFSNKSDLITKKYPLY